MITAENVFQLTQLAEASYAYFDPNKLTKVAIKSALENKSEEPEESFSDKQADLLLESWNIVSEGHLPNTESGYSSTLFQNRDGSFVLAFRGTEGLKSDDLWSADIGDIVTDGLAIKQIVDMYNEWQRIISPLGQAYSIAKLDYLSAETEAYIEATLKLSSNDVQIRELAQEAIDALKSRPDVIFDNTAVYTINYVTSSDLGLGLQEQILANGLTVTGHSLGGHLASSFVRLFPEVGAEALTVNGAGFPTGSTPGLTGNAELNIQNLFSLLGGADTFIPSDTFNVFGEDMYEFVTMNQEWGLIQPGQHTALYIEQPDLFGNTFGHGSSQMTDSAAVYDLLIQLDANLQDSPIDFALPELTRFFEVSSNKDKTTLESIVSSISSLFLENSSIDIDSNGEFINREALYSVISNIKSASKYIEGAYNFSIIEDFGNLVSLAQTNIAYRYALANLNPFAITGDDSLYDSHNQNGELDLYNPETGEGQLTDEYLTDRAEMLRTLIQFNIEGKDYDESISAGLINTTYSDLTEDFNLSAESNYSYFEDSKKVIFGSELGEDIQGGNQADKLYGMGGDDTISGGKGRDRIEGGYGKDILNGDDSDDILLGQKGEDTLVGGNGKDILIGGYQDSNKTIDDNEVDTLNGGTGFDTYYVGDGDKITDDDLDGKVIFKGEDLSGVKNKKEDAENEYTDDMGYTYKEDGSTLTVTKDGQSFTIENWDSDKQQGLGIELNNKIKVNIEDNSALEASETMTFNVSLSRALNDGEELSLDVKGETITFSPGEKTKNYTYTWTDNKKWELNREISIDASIASFTGGKPEDVEIENGQGTIVDDDDKKRLDPLALDTNKDGVISTTSLEDSGTYFDITGDGLRERVGWIKSEDALVAYDRNENGQIDGIDEVFGNLSENGFDELKRVADSNFDNVIDRKDELFNQLQTWNDLNQDGLVQDGELQSLQAAGVENIGLNYVSTDIDLNGNRLTEASRYTDSQGNRELAADIQLAADQKDTKVEIGDILGLEIDDSTRLLPQFKGSGLVYDALIQYNLDPEFRAIAEELASDPLNIATNFQAFMDSYSGYNAYINEFKERFSVDDVDMLEDDKTLWVYSRFEGDFETVNAIQQKYENSFRNIDSVSATTGLSSSILASYEYMLSQLESGFALQSVFNDVSTVLEYNEELNKYSVSDPEVFTAQIIDYLNSDLYSTDEKVYLAHTLYQRSGELEVNVDGILSGITNSILQSLIAETLIGDSVSYFEREEAVSVLGDVVLGSSGNDVINLKTSDDQTNQHVYLKEGDDKVISNTGNQYYLFNRGDGFDTIGDIGGTDRLVFGDGINRDDVEVKLQRNADLIIAIKETDKPFDELTDRVLMVDWMRPDNRLEVIEFADGSTLRLQDVFEQYEASDSTDVVELSSGNDTFDGKAGNDVINAGGGNDKLTGSEGDDRLIGGSGNDTYYFGRGDGQDTVVDSEGHDTLQFEAGVEFGDLVARFKGADLQIAINEEGKTFDQLADVITLQNFNNADASIESVFLDGFVRVNIQDLLNKPTIEDDELIYIDKGVDVDLLAGNDTVTTSDADDSIYGNDGNDVISTNGGNDVLEGDLGNDTLEGGRGNDLYIFNRGDGKDTIFDDYSFGYHNTLKEDAGNDSLLLGEGITSDDIVIKYYGADLMIGIKEGDKPFSELNDVITIKNYGDDKNKIEHIVLSNGNEVDITLPESAYGYATVATTGDDILFFEENISIDTLQGHDFIHTGNGNDDVFGNVGNDDIHTGDGEDILNGGVGIDYLFGGDGNDTYIFNRGDGNNTIFDDNRDGYVPDTNMYHGMYTTYPKITGSSTPQKDAGIDTLVFGEGIALDDIEVKISTKSFSSSSRDIVIYVKDDEGQIAARNTSGDIVGDAVTIRDYFDSRNKIENILLSDGTQVDIDSMVNQITSGNDQITYLSSNEDMTLDALEGNDIVKIGLGDDTIIGGKGDDELEGGGGNDTYVFNLGDGKDSIYDHDEIRGGDSRFQTNAGNDTLKFGIGITPEDLLFILQDSDLVIKIANTEDSITIKNYEDSNNAIENIVFDDGTNVDLIDMALKFLGENVVIPDQDSQENIYILNHADGVKTIFNSSANDTLQIAEGIGVEQLIARFVGNDLIVALKESGVAFDALKDKVIIKNYVYDKIESIILNDGTKIKLNDMLLQASEGDDTLSSYEQEAIVIDGLAGNDDVSTGQENDVILGNSGNDRIYANAGADDITGGQGDDYLSGGVGNDSYFYSRGDGKDVISDEAGTDQIFFGEGIVYEDLAFKQDGSNLIIAIQENGKSFADFSDKITIIDWFNQATNIESLQFTNDISVDSAALAYTILNLNPDTLFSKNGAEMRGGLGNDTYVYKKGDFTVVIDDGVYNEDIQINAGNDILQFEDITLDQVTLGIQGRDLIIKIDAGHDTYQELKDYVVIRDWQEANRGIESISFADGEILAIDKTAINRKLSFDENWITSRYYIYGAEDNVIAGSQFSEVIEAGVGNDVVNAYNGSDRLVGQAGNDTLNGGEGNDTYVFQRGDGQDIIIDSQGVDALVLNGGITQEEVLFEQVDNDLVIALAEDGKSFTELSDKVTLTEWFTGIDGRVEYLALDGQDIISIADLIIEPTEQDDSLEYGDENNNIDALAGNDTIYIGGGDDVLAGNDGDDQLYAGSGDDVVSGDAGTDTLYGAEGNDTYLFGRGDGQDTVIEDNFNDWGTTGKDTLKFKEGVSSADIILVQQGEDLIVGLSEEGKTFEQLADKITLKKWSTYDQENSRDYSRAYYTVEQFSFADGTVWNMADIIANIGSSENDAIYGFNQNDTLEGLSGNDSLYGRLGDDTYVFNRGDGHDTVYDYGQKDDDTSYYDAGNDTLQFGDGIGANDLIFVIAENQRDLKVYIKEEGKDLDGLQDTLLLKDWTKANTRVENFVLQDGTVLDIANYLTPEPTENNDVLIYSNNADYVDALAGDDIVFAQGGDDTVLGNAGNDELQGGSGEDSLIGGEGDDTLSGGVDNDYLEGGVGSDRYIFNLGDGYDVISDFSEDLTDSDVIRFGEGIDSGSVIFSQEENDLVIAISSEDRLTVQNWYANNGYRIEAVVFDDGSSLSADEVEQIVQSSQNREPVIVNDVPEKRAVNFYNATNSQITGLSDGGFVIGWDLKYFRNNNLNSDVLLEVFDSNSEKVGENIEVNTYLENDQTIQDMVTLTSGDYVSLWTSFNQDGINSGVYLQQFTSTGVKVGEEVQVNTYTDDSQFAPMITPIEDGGYVVVWASRGQDGSFDGVFLQQFTDDGQKSGSETQVNTYIDNHQDSPVITSLAGGGYVVGWNSYDQDGSGSGAYMQVFDSSGNKVGAEQRVHTDTDDNQYIGEFVGLSDGGFAVTFIGADGGTKHFHVRKYDQDGLLVGQEQNFDYVVNIYTSKPKVIPLEDGGFISAWVAINDDGSSEGVYLQRHDSQAEKVGEEHRVNNTDNYSLNIVDVTLLDGGEYVIAWESSDGYYGGTSDIFTQRFDSELHELGDERKANYFKKATPDSADVTQLNDGGYALSFTADDGVYYQQFDALGNKVGQEVSPQTDFILWSGETLSRNFDYIHDPDGDTLSFSWDLATEVDSVLDGDFSLNQDGSWSYIAGSNYDFYDEFTITVNDGHGGVLEQTLTFENHQTLLTPLVLDLNGNGTTSISIDESNAYFDYDGDGNREHTAWQEEGDAQLVADLNFDGKISDGTEIFGDFTLLADGSRAKNGYEALEQYDSNGDRVIDSQDVLFGNLSLWQDYNQNGKSEAGELTNIQLSEVTAIYLDSDSGITFEQRQENGNTILNETNYMGVDGTTGIIRDVGFVYNALDTITNNDTLSTKFYGQLLSGEDGDDTYVFNSGDGVVTINDNGDGSDRLVFGENITPEQLIVRWDKTNNGLIIGVKESADDASSIYDVTDKIAIHDWFEDSGAIETFEFADGSVLSRESLYEQYTSLAESQGLNARVLDTNGELAGGDFADVLYGAEGEEKLEGLAGNDYLRGLSGDDYLLAGSGNDTLEGGLGDDTLYSESGNDYYLYSRGDGKDLIQDFSGYDRLVFGEGITQEDVIIEQDGYDLLIGITEEGKSISELSDLIRIEGQFIAGFQIEQIELYSGELIQLNHNDVPDINSVSVSLLEDESFSGQLSVNGNANGLIYEVENSSEFASFSIDENGQYTYTPNENFNGQDSVTVKVTNAKGQTDTEVLSFDVESVNDAPTVNNSAESILLQNIRSQNGVVSVSDVDGDALNYSVSTQALNGSLTIDTEGQWHYQADDLYIGQDLAVVTVDDGQGGFVTQTLNFDVSVSTPVFDDNEVMLLEDNQASGAFNVVNPVGGDLSYELVSSSANGALTLDSVGNWEYTPNDNYNGSDSISIKVTNEYGLSATSTLNFNIESVNDAPVLDNDQETVLLQDVRSSQGKVNAFDVEGDLLSYVVTEQAVNGVISLDSEGNWNYQANALYLGQDSAVITVDDGLGGTVTKTLNFDINVSSPSLANSSIFLEEDGTTDGVFNVINPIGGELTFQLVSGSEHGELMFDNSGHWNYTPSANYNGEDTVTIKVTNEYGLSSSSNLSFSIEAVNDAPIVTTESESFTLTNIRDVGGRIEASDVDGDSLLYSVQGSPENGSLVIDENGYWNYRADASFNGDDSAVIMIDDGNGGNVTTTLNFTVEGYQYEGQDLIINDNSGGDTLVMNGVEKRDLQFSRQGDALSIRVRDEATVTLSNYFVDVLSGVEEIVTDQGSISLAKDVITQMTPWDWWTFGDDGVNNLIDGSSYSDWIFGGNQSDVLLGSSGSDDISGFGGNDTIIGGNGRDYIYGDSGDDNLYGDNQADYLYGGQGSDTLVGGSGNDQLYAQNGNDLLVGGTGQDILKGGNGDDVYGFTKGDGIDLIRDTGGFDTIQFGEGVGKEDISFFMQNARLYLQYSDTDSVTIAGQSKDDNQIERIELNDGSYMTNADIDLIVQQMSAFASEKGIWKPDNNDIRNNEQMMQIVTSGWQI
ncbi:hypothetical protein JCM30760_02590 [Thiomicrorhabdus hydrogeniphila]